MAKGHVEQLPSGSHRVTVYAGKDPITGKKVYLKETCPDEVKAAEALARLLRQADSRRRPDRSATVSHLLERWLEVADLELSTRETNEGYIRRTINPVLGEMPVRKLQDRVDVLDQLYTHLRRCRKLCQGRLTTDHRTNRPHECHVVRHHARRAHDCSAAGCRVIACRPHVCTPMTPGTIRRINAILSAALNYAVAWGWIERNPAALAHLPKQTRQRARLPEAEAVARLINHAWEKDPQFGLVLWLAVITGGRRAEVCALRWEDVDFEHGTLCLDENYIVRQGKRQLKATKTDEDRRLSLDTLTVALLTAYRQVRAEALGPVGVQLAPDGFVFSPDPAGARPWNPDTFTHRYLRLAAEVGITTPLKNLRHFNATQLLSSGVDLRTTAGRLGHADGGATTLRFYADWIRPADQRAAEALARDLHKLRGQVENDS
jgi:integrase